MNRKKENPDKKTPPKPEQKRSSQDEDQFPGYPHYPAKEDIFNPGNDEDKIPLDTTGENLPGEISPVPPSGQRKSRSDDLDIPGSELDDENESIGEEDEENNYYSIGGDRHENLEDDPNE